MFILGLEVLISVGDRLYDMLEGEDPFSSSVWRGGSLRGNREDRQIEWRRERPI